MFAFRSLCASATHRRLNFIRTAVILVAVVLLPPAASPAEAQTYLSHFYTPGDVIVFMPEAGTAVTLRTPGGTTVWSNSVTLQTGEVKNVTGLAAGFYRVTSNKKIVLMAGDMVTGSGNDTRSYYARDVDGNAAGTELYTYLRSSSEEDTPTLYVFSHQSSNTVTVRRRGEFMWEQVWSGTLADGAYQAVTLGSVQPIKITSTAPVSALVAGASHYDDPGAHCVPAISSGTFYGDRFVTWIPGGEAYVYAWSDDTQVDLRNTITLDPTPRASWDLDEGEVGSYAIPFNQPFSITVQSTRPISLCRMYQDLAGSNGMHYLPAKSGTAIGTEFIIDANDPIEVIAYTDGTSVEYTRLNGMVHSYTLNAGGHQLLPAGTRGRLTALKAVSVLSRSNIGAAFVPIPVSTLDTAPGPPAVFAVKHYPPSPTVNDNSVTVSFATDEPCTSAVAVRRNGGIWFMGGSNPTWATQHAIAINISSFSPDDLVEYYVWATDKDNNTVVNNNDSQYYSFTIIDNIPDLSVSRLSAYAPSSNDDPYTVNLMIENTGIAEARNIRIRERITGMISPTIATGIEPITTREFELEVVVPDIPAGGREYVSYELIPMLYGAFATYGIGLSTPSTISYQSPVGLGFNEIFWSPMNFAPSTALGWIRGKDYVVATNISRLRALNTDAAAGMVLEEAARFALARDAVVAELQTTDRYAIERLVDSSWNGRLGFIGWGGWRYLMLLGCQGVVPSFDYKHKCTSFSPRYAPIADNTYADVNTGDHFKPELIVGRLPGESANQLRDQLQNSLTPISTDRRVLISGTGEGESKFVDCINDVEGWLGQYTTTVKRHWKDYPDKPSKISAFLADAPNTDLFVYRNHGGVTAWDGTVGNVEVPLANFGSKHPMVWSIACLTGKISGDSLAETFLDSGASLFIGATEVSPRSPNNDFAHYLAKYHTMHLYYETMGEVFKWAKRKVIDENIHWYTTCWNDHRNKQLVNMYNLYGDPKRYETPISKRAALSREAAKAGEGPPPEYIELELPDYVVTSTEEGVDYVTFPGEEGGTYEEDGQPIVPIYLHRVAFGPEFKISGLILEEWGGRDSERDLHLPVASFADGGTDSFSSPPTKASSSFPVLEAPYSWRVEEQLDGSHELILTVFPFYYDPATAIADFYRFYLFRVFSNPSNTAITSITPTADVFDPEDPIEGLIHIDHTGRPVEATLVVELLDESSNDVIGGMEPQPVGLEEGEIAVDFGIALETPEPTAYLLRARLAAGEQVFDEATKQVRVGVVSAVGEALEVQPAPSGGFEIGHPISVAAWFQNTCEYLISGRTRLQIIDNGTGAVVHENVREVALDPGATHEAGTEWITTSAAEGTYRVSAVLEYNGMSTDPMTQDLFTLRHMNVRLFTDRQVYDVGDKVAVWAEITDPDGAPLEAVSTLSLAIPNGSIVPVQLSYFSNLGLYSGWHYLATGSPDGPYGLALHVESPGYHPVNRQHFFSVGGAPPIPGFTWSPPSPAPGQTVQFTDTSTGQPIAWMWSFGDGGTSTAQNPTHVYEGFGEWEVVLGVTNAFGTSWIAHEVPVSLGGNAIFADGFESGDCEAWSMEVPGEK